MIRAVPAALRDHRRRFRKPARYVVDLGGGEYFVFTEDGELLDAMMIEQILAMLPPLKPIAMNRSPRSGDNSSFNQLTGSVLLNGLT